MMRLPVSAAPGDTAVTIALAGTLAYLASTSPLVTLGFAVLALLGAPGLHRVARAALLCLFALSLSLVYGSRQFAGSAFDDFANIYYPSYLRILETQSLVVGAESDDLQISSFEIGLPLLFRALSLLPVRLSPNLLIFIVTLLCSLTYVWWLERYFLVAVPPAKRAAAGLLCMALFSFGLCSQTTRQMFSVPLLLAALWEPSWRRRLPMLAAATLFHLSALPIFAIAIAIRTMPKVTVPAALLGCAFLIGAGESMLSNIVGIDVGALDKLRYYTEENRDAEGYDATFIPIVVVCVGLAYLARRFDDGQLFRLVLVFAAVFFALLPLPLASFRLTLFLTTALVGPLFCLALADRLSVGQFGALALLLTLAQLLRRIAFADETSGMGLWHVFRQFEPIPFDYLLRLAR